MSEGIQFKGLIHSDIDCIVNYSGNIWTLVMKEERDRQTRPRRSSELRSTFRTRHGVVCLGGLGFENAYALAMPRSDKRPPELQAVHTVAELAEILRRSKRPMRIGGDMQFFERPEWRRVKEVYRLKDEWFRTVPMDPTRMYDAVVDGQVDVIVAYSSDGRIPEYQLEILQDPDSAFPQYYALLLVSRRGARNSTTGRQPPATGRQDLAGRHAGGQPPGRREEAAPPQAAAELLQKVGRRLKSAY